MEATITISGLGAGIPGTSFGVNIISGAYIEIRGSESSPSRVYGIVDTLSVGNDSSTIGLSHIQTDWMYINPKNYPLFSLESLQDTAAEINISGTLIGSGDVDVKLEVINTHGEPTTLLDLKSIKSNSSFQIASTKIRGKLKFLTSSPKVEQ